MKKLFLLPLASALLASCNDVQQESTPNAAPTVSIPTGRRLTGKLDVSSLARFTKIGLGSKINVSLFTLDGTLIDRTAALQPNTIYRLVIDKDENLQVRACLGFDLLNKDEPLNQQKGITSFMIKTHTDVLEAPMISIVPLQRVGTTIYREQAQTIALTK